MVGLKEEGIRDKEWIREKFRIPFEALEIKIHSFEVQKIPHKNT